MPESPRIEFLENFSGNNFALSDVEDNTSGSLKMIKFISKGYLCCKTITSQNLLSKAQVGSFLFHRKSLVFVFLTIPWYTKSVMSWWVLVQGTFLSIPFESQLISPTNVVQLIDISKDNIFVKSFEQFGGMGLNSRPLLI